MNIREKLRELNVNISGLCRELVVSTPTFYRYLNGERPWPLKTALKLCEIYPTKFVVDDFTNTETVPEEVHRGNL